MDFLAFIADLIRLNFDFIEIHLVLWAVTAGFSYLFAKEEFAQVFQASRNHAGSLRGPAMFLLLFVGSVIIGSFMGEFLGLFMGMKFGVDLYALFFDTLAFSVMIGSVTGSLWLYWKAHRAAQEAARENPEES
jgi:hypothetical protein